LDAPYGIAVDNANVYWANYGTGADAGTIMMCAVAGCGGHPTTLASGQDGAYGVTVKAGNIYWTTQNGGSVMKCAVGACGTSLIPLATGQDTPTNITVDATNVYWTNDDTPIGTVVKCAIGGCNNNPITLAAGQTYPFGIAVDTANVYWVNYTGAALECPISGCPLSADGGSSPTVLAAGQNESNGIAVDTTTVYWANEGVYNTSTNSYTNGAVMKCSVNGCGGNPTALVSAQAGVPYAIAVDDMSIYWTDYGGGYVMKLAK
jgi:hypothetical protein